MPCLTTFTSENTLPPDRNRYLVLYLNFSGIVGELHNYRKRLDAHCGTTFENFCKIYADYLPQDTVDELIEIIKPWYDNYCFTEECYGETTMHNSNMVLYFVKNIFNEAKHPGITNPDNFVSLLYYFGMLTISGMYEGKTKLTIPNQVVREQIYTYLLSTYDEADLSFSGYEKNELPAPLPTTLTGKPISVILPTA